MFLRKLADAREQKRIAARGGDDEMMRVILVSEERRRRAELARAASAVATFSPIEEETEYQLLREEEELMCEFPLSFHITLTHEKKHGLADMNLDGTIAYELAEEQDREFEAILAQLEIADHTPSLSSSSESSAQQPQNDRSAPNQTFCGGCGERGSLVDIDGEHVCFSCGWCAD